MIEVSNLSKKYGRQLAVNSLNFTIKKGKTTGFLGANGAGKSTTLNLITGYLAPSRGSIKVGGYNMSTESLQAKTLIGYLGEQAPLYSDLTINEYYQFVARLKKVTSQQLKKDKDLIYTMLQLGDVQHRLIKNLSKGYRQRVGVGLALIGSPPLLILDEPTVGLDPSQIIEFRNLIKYLKNENKTILLSSHILSELEHLCDDALIIHKGQIVATNAMAALANELRYANPIIIKMVAANDDRPALLKQLATIASIEEVTDDEDGTLSYRLKALQSNDIRAKVFNIIKCYNVTVLGLSSHQSSLENIFINLTRGNG